jgi:hypothetical protein
MPALLLFLFVLFINVGSGDSRGAESECTSRQLTIAIDHSSGICCVSRKSKYAHVTSFDRIVTIELLIVQIVDIG